MHYEGLLTLKLQGLERSSAGNLSFMNITSARVVHLLDAVYTSSYQESGLSILAISVYLVSWLLYSLISIQEMVSFELISMQQDSLLEDVPRTLRARMNGD